MTEKNAKIPAKWDRPAKPEFHGTYVTLQHLVAEDDAADLYAASHGSEAATRLWDYMPYGPFADQGAMKAWLKSVEDSEDPLYYAVWSVEKQKVAGIITIMSIVPAMGRAELGGIWYGPEFQKTPINTESVFLLLTYLFDELGYRRVEWKCDDNNVESKRAAARLGFQFEGLFRQHMVVKGKNRDTAWFAVVDHDWPALRENFSIYLSDPTRASLTEMNAKALAPEPAPHARALASAVSSES